MEYVKEINTVVNRFIWGRGMLAVFLFVGVMFTVRTGFFQFTKVRSEEHTSELQSQR